MTLMCKLSFWLCAFKSLFATLFAQAKFGIQNQNRAFYHKVKTAGRGIVAV
jgi:hypothetical protein